MYALSVCLSDKLRGKVWDEKAVRPNEAGKEGREVHVGSLHELVVEKGSELQDGDETGRSKGGLYSSGTE